MISAGPRHESELIRALTHLDDKEQKLLKYWKLFFPTCQVRVVRFYQSCSPPPPPPHPPPPRPPRSPDPSGHSRTSTASARSQWALPDLHRELQIPVGTDFQIAVGTAGPQPRLPDRSGHCRTSTATSRSQWGLPDLNGQIECQKICQIECNARRYARTYARRYAR